MAEMCRQPVLIPCKLCSHQFSTLKVIPCSHSSCDDCLKKEMGKYGSEMPYNFVCTAKDCGAKHRIPSIDKLLTLHAGLLTCHLCDRSKPTSEVYWCPECVKIFCAVCCMDSHSSMGHDKVYKWESLQAVKDVYRFAKEKSEISNQKRPEGPSMESKEKVRVFCAQIEVRRDLMVSRLIFYKLRFITVFIARKSCGAYKTNAGSEATISSGYDSTFRSLGRFRIQ